jgi:hypothetical protein
MFCPKCKTEYREGFRVCADCGVELAAGRPPAPEERPVYVEFTELLTTHNTADIAFLKSILDSENITYYFHGENFSRIDPMIQPARLMVKTDEVEKVRELIAGLGISFLAINISESEKPSD